MASIVLKDWDWAGHYWLLDTTSGTAQPHRSAVYHGFLSAFPENDRHLVMPRVAAVYADDGRLWFQLDGRRWEFHDVRFAYRLDASGTSQFIVVHQGITVADIMYVGPAGDPVNKSDPSFDEVDMEMQDIFYFLARNARDPSLGTRWLTYWESGSPAED